MSLIGVPFSGGQKKKGVDRGPEVLRPRILALGEELKYDIVDCGDVDIPPVSSSDVSVSDVKNPKAAGKVCENLYNLTKREVKKNNAVLIMGGDHSIAIGSIAGSASEHPGLGVLWIDAHADINTTKSSQSQSLHGMPVSFLMGMNGDIPGFEWLTRVETEVQRRPLLQKDQLIYIGLRDLDPQEKEFLRERHIKSFDMHDIDKRGIHGVVDMALKTFGHRPIHISFDIDSLDPREAPSTGTPVRGGLTYREGAFICEYVSQHSRLVSMDIVEVNPSLGTPEDVTTTLDSAMCMIKSTFGKTITTKNYR